MNERMNVQMLTNSFLKLPSTVFHTVETSFHCSLLDLLLPLWLFLLRLLFFLTLGSQFPLWLTSMTHFLSFSPHPSPQCFLWPFCGNDWHLCVSSPDFSLTLGPLCQLPPGISTWMRSLHPKFSMSILKSHLGSLFQSAMHHFPSHPNS